MPDRISGLKSTDEEKTNPKPGESIDLGKGRIFPCDRCGADLEFSIGQQSLQCSYCGSIKEIELPPESPIVERDFLEMLDRLKRLRESQSPNDESATTNHAIHCNSCGAEVVFQGTLTSTHCPYCACPLQRDNIHDSVTRIPVDGMLPFLVPQAQAAQNLRAWAKSLWWAPNEFLKQGANGKFNGVYLPFFTFDALTFTRYNGQRGSAYFVTIETENHQRTVVREVRWTPACGDFQRFFDDVLIIAASRQQASLIQSLEPWPLEHLIPFTPQVLAGFFSRTYDVELEDGFQQARRRIESELSREVRERIGGDEQKVHSEQTNYSAITYKHLLLPVWLLAYRFHDQTYQVMINATTGQVSGQRPYSWVKISFAIAVTAMMGTALWWFAQSSR